VSGGWRWWEVGGEVRAQQEREMRDDSLRGRGKRMQVNHADPFRGCKDTWYTKNVMVFFNCSQSILQKN
jgi:hypothetical protein